MENYSFLVDVKTRILDSNWNKLVCNFHITVCHFHARVQSSTSTTYGKFLPESIMTLLTPKSSICRIQWDFHFFLNTLNTIFDPKIQNCLFKVKFDTRIQWWSSLHLLSTGHTDIWLKFTLTQIWRIQWSCLLFLFLNGNIRLWQFCFKKSKLFVKAEIGT